jgi:hypothetical protein
VQPNKHGPVVDVLKAGGEEAPKSGARTRRWNAARQSEAEATLAMLPKPNSGTSAEITMQTTVKRYDPRSMSGELDAGREVLPFSSSAVITAGIVGLHPGQNIEAKVARQSDGSLVVKSISLGASELTRRRAELAREAQESENRYLLTVGRQGGR